MNNSSTSPHSPPRGDKNSLTKAEEANYSSLSFGGLWCMFFRKVHSLEILYITRCFMLSWLSVLVWRPWPERRHIFVVCVCARRRRRYIQSKELICCSTTNVNQILPHCLALPRSPEGNKGIIYLFFLLRLQTWWKCCESPACRASGARPVTPVRASTVPPRSYLSDSSSG